MWRRPQAARVTPFTGHGDLRAQGIRDVALLVRFMVHPLDVGRVGRAWAREAHLGMQHDARDGFSAALIGAHGSERVVLVSIDDEARPRRHVQKRQHVTGGGGCDQRLLRIDVLAFRVGQRHGRDGARCRHDDPAVESPLVRTAVARVDKRFAGTAVPDDVSGVFGHGSDSSSARGGIGLGGHRG